MSNESNNHNDKFDKFYRDKAEGYKIKPLKDAFSSIMDATEASSSPKGISTKPLWKPLIGVGIGIILGLISWFAFFHKTVLEFEPAPKTPLNPTTSSKELENEKNNSIVPPTKKPIVAPRPINQGPKQNKDSRVISASPTKTETPKNKPVLSQTTDIGDSLESKPPVQLEPSPDSVTDNTTIAVEKKKNGFDDYFSKHSKEATVDSSNELFINPKSKN